MKKVIDDSSLYDSAVKVAKEIEKKYGIAPKDIPKEKQKQKNSK